jgi:hemerythrin-like domain-containing protein
MARLQDPKSSNPLLQGPSQPAECDILDTLAREHDELRKLISAFRVAQDATGRRELLGQIQAALSLHYYAEERVVYRALRRLSPEGSRVHLRQAFAEHAWTLQAVRRLKRLKDTDTPHFHAYAALLMNRVAQHLADEEARHWNDLEQSLSEEVRLEMNRFYLLARRRRRQPH